MNYEQFLRDRITSLRLEHDMSEYHLSLELGKCKTYIQAITSGKSLPSLDAFLDICDFFHLTPEEFFASQEEDTEQTRRLKHKISLVSKEDLDLLEQLVDRLLSANTGGAKK